MKEAEKNQYESSKYPKNASSRVYRSVSTCLICAGDSRAESVRALALASLPLLCVASLGLAVAVAAADSLALALGADNSAASFTCIRTSQITISLH